MRILNFGSLNIDKTYFVDHIVKAGETLSVESYKEFIGGKGLNQSIAMARAGAKVWHAGLVGEEDGQVLVEALRDSGVNVEQIESRSKASGHTIIQVDREGNNCILVAGGTNHMIDPPYIDRVLSNFASGDLLLVQNEISHLDYLIDCADAMGMKIVFNPSPINASIFALDFCKIDWLMINEIEGEEITRKKEPYAILESLIHQFPHIHVLLTLGEQGAIYQDRDHRYCIPAEKVQVADTTGAGDTFCGFFIAGIVEGRSIEDSLKLASRAAGKTCERVGASPSIPWLKELI